MKLRNALAGVQYLVVYLAIGCWMLSLTDILPSLLSNHDAHGNPNSSVQVRKVCWSSDSKKLLSVVRGDSGMAGSLVMHELGDGPTPALLDVYGDVLVTADLSPDDGHVLVATHDGMLWWTGMQSTEYKLLLQLPSPIDLSCAVLSPDGTKVAAATSHGALYLINPHDDPESSKPLSLVGESQSRISYLQFSKDGRMLVSSRCDGSISVWSLESGKICQNWNGHGLPVTGVGFLPDNRVIAASLDDTIRLLEIGKNREVWRKESGLLGVTALAVSSDGKTAACGGYGRKVIVWDLETLHKKFEIQIAASNVWDLQFSPDNSSLAIAGNDGTLRVHDALTGAEREMLGVRGEMHQAKLRLRDHFAPNDRVIDEF